MLHRLDLSKREPYSFPRLENDDQFRGRRPFQPLRYSENAQEAQEKDPWRRLNSTSTLSKLRREIYSFDPQAPKDDLDFVLKSVYDNGEDTFRNKNEVLFQKETVGLPHGRQLRNRIKFIPPPPPELNHPVFEVSEKAKKSIHSIHHHQCIEGHHSATSNNGYSRKPDGGFFAT